MEIASGVHQIEGIRFVNVFLVVGERLTLVDTGVGGSGAAIERYVHRLGRTLDELDMVVLTHHHEDHVGALEELRRNRSFLVAAHEADAP